MFPVNCPQGVASLAPYLVPVVRDQDLSEDGGLLAGSLVPPVPPDGGRQVQLARGAADDLAGVDAALLQVLTVPATVLAAASISSRTCWAVASTGSQDACMACRHDPHRYYFCHAFSSDFPKMISHEYATAEELEDETCRLPHINPAAQATIPPTTHLSSRPSSIVRGCSPPNTPLGRSRGTPRIKRFPSKGPMLGRILPHLAETGEDLAESLPPNYTYYLGGT